MCPELMYGGVHGDDALSVFQELGQAVDAVIEIMKDTGKPPPAPKALVFEKA